MSAIDPSQDDLDATLHDVAKKLLCGTHKSQSQDVVGRWKKALELFDLSLSTSHDRSQPAFVYSIDNQTDRIEQLRENVSYQGPGQQYSVDRFGPGNARVGHAAFVGTEIHTTQRNKMLRLYERKAADHRRAIAEVMAAEQEMNSLAERLGGIKITEVGETLDPAPTLSDPGSGRELLSNRQDGIVGDCGICMGSLQDWTALVCCIAHLKGYMHWRCIAQWWHEGHSQRCPLW